MKALIIKDLLVLRGYVKTLLGILVLYTIWGISDRQIGFLSGISGLLCVLMTLSSFSYDAQAKWNRFGATLPLTRRQTVGAKYLLGLLMMGAGAVLTLSMLWLYAIIRGANASDVFATLLGTCCAGFLLISVLLPATYQFGVEKSRLILLAVVMILTIGIGVLSYAGVPAPSARMIQGLAIAFPLLVVLLFGLSYRLSCRIFERQEI